MKIGKIEINDTRAAAFSNSSAGKGHAGFAETTGPPDEISLFGVSEDFALEYGIIIIRQSGYRPCEGGKFNEDHTRYYITQSNSLFL
ncbi:MAG: hypothetical protein WCI20_11260 [bacterium]